MRYPIIFQSRKGSADHKILWYLLHNIIADSSLGYHRINYFILTLRPRMPHICGFLDFLVLAIFWPAPIVEFLNQILDKTSQSLAR